MKCNTRTEISSTIDNNQRLPSKMMTRNQNQGDHASIVGNPNTTSWIILLSKETKENINSKEDITKLEELTLHEKAIMKNQTRVTLAMKKKLSTFVLWLIKERRKR